jgi:hypothetical protein
VADKAVTLLIVIAEPEPAAVIEPGNAVELVSVAQDPDDTVWVALTTPLALVQAEEKSILTDVAPAEAVVNTNRTGEVLPAPKRFNLT